MTDTDSRTVALRLFDEASKSGGFAYNHALTDEQIAAGVHRELVGGMWDTLGKLQAEFLAVQAKLQPGMKLLDIGCGSLRGGVHIVPLLDAGNYYGVDYNKSLLDAGYEIEAKQAGIQDKLPRKNLLHEQHFRFDRFGSGVQFDVALAQSLFTHLPLNSIRRCLYELAKVTKTGSRLFATIWVCPPEHPIGEPFSPHPSSKLQTTCDQSPFHYYVDDLKQAAAGLPWHFAFHGNWDHPRNQQMLIYTRI